MAVDPTYPLYPIITLISSVLLLILLMTNFVRQSWNLGVTFLCFWLFWENLSSATSAIIWADNADLKLYIYCDIVSHLYMFTYIVKPACTLILTRRLYKIASLRSLVPDSRRAKLIDVFVEWSLGLGLPVLVTGVFYYIVQGARFEITEGIGCQNTANPSGVEILLLEPPGVILPLISLVFYCPKIIYVFYRHSRDTNQFLQTNGSVTRSSYFRILALGCLDIFLTLPFGIMSIISMLRAFSGQGLSLQWYSGWSFTHSDWDPVSLSWIDVTQAGPWELFNFYFVQWSSVILALAMFTLFGFTAESRVTYTRWVYAGLKLFGWTPSVREHETMGELQFGIRSLVGSGQARTQQSALVAISIGHIGDEDIEQGLSPEDELDLAKEGNNTHSASRSLSQNIGTDTIFQADHANPSRNCESANDLDERGGTRIRDSADVPSPASLREDVGRSSFARSPEDMKANSTS